MTDVTHIFNAGETVLAANVNQNFQDLLGLISALPASKLEGSIPFNKLLHNKGLAWSTLQMVPPTGAASAGGQPSLDPAAWTTGTLLPAARPATANNLKIQPVVLPGWQVSLVAVVVHVLRYDVSGTDQPRIDFRHNGTTQLGGGDVILNTNDQIYLIARNDPVLNPLRAFADGDYLEIAMWGPSGTPEPVGLTVTLGWKHRLVQ